MSVELYSIFNNLNPYSALKKLKVPFTVNAEENLIYAECPHCKKHSAQVGKYDIYCGNANCKFTSGNLVDYLAFNNRAGYAGALSIVFDNLYEKLNDISIYDKEYAKTFLKSKLESSRKVVDWLISLRSNIARTNIYKSAHMWFRKNNIDYKHVFNSVFLCRGEDVKHLYKIVNAELDIDDLEDAEEFSIFPYFTTHTSVGLIELLRHSNDRTITLKINNAKYNFFGLLSSGLNTTEFKCYDSLADTLQDTSINKGNLAKGISSLSIKKGNSAVQIFRPDELTYMVTPDTDVGDLDIYRGAARKFHLCTHERYGFIRTKTNWSDFLFSRFKELLQKHKKLSPDIISFLDSITLNKIQLEKFTKYVKDIQRNDVLGLLNESVSVNKIIKFNSFDVIATPFGYIAQKKNSPDQVPFTNFIVDIEEALTFKNSDSIFYKGGLITNGKRYEIMFDRETSSKPVGIEVAAQRAYKNFHSSGILPSALPTITDTSIAKCLPQIIRSSTNNVRPVLGIDLLGWNIKTDSFITPGCTVGINGVSKNESELHPGYQTYQHYRTTQVSKPAEEFYNEDVLNVLSVILVQLGRGFFGFENHAIKFRNTVTARNLFKFIYSALGQRSYISIGSNNRKNNTFELNGLYNYPAFAMCDNHDKVDPIKFPLNVLTSTGLTLDSKITDHDFPKIATFSERILFGFIKWMLATEGAEFNSDIDVSNPLEIIRAGRILLNKIEPSICASVVEQDFPKLRALLYGIAEDELDQYFRIDFELQLGVVTFLRKFVGHRKHILQELQEKDPQSALYRNVYLTCNLDMLNNLLADVYGKKIQLSLFRKKKDDSTEAQDSELEFALEN